MFDLLKPALLRLVPYIAAVLFGVIGAFIQKLGLGVYDDAAGTITVSKTMFEALAYSAVAGGGLAIVAVLRGWKSKA
mgnify:CR=1 FL=1